MNGKEKESQQVLAEAGQRLNATIAPPGDNAETWSLASGTGLARGEPFHTATFTREQLTA